MRALVQELPERDGAGGGEALTEITVENFRWNICKADGCNRHLARKNKHGYCRRHWQEEILRKKASVVDGRKTP